MGVILTHDFTNDTGALLGLAVEAEAHVVHAEEDAPLDGFEAVAGVRQGTGNDHGHRVVDVCRAHLVVYLNLLYVSGVFLLLYLVLLFVIIHSKKYLSYKHTKIVITMKLYKSFEPD